MAGHYDFRGDNTRRLDRFFDRQIRRIKASLSAPERLRQRRQERFDDGDDLDFVVTELSEKADCLTVRR